MARITKQRGRTKNEKLKIQVSDTTMNTLRTLFSLMNSADEPMSLSDTILTAVDEGLIEVSDCAFAINDIKLQIYLKTGNIAEVYQMSIAV